jgi:hypothetical protein
MKKDSTKELIELVELAIARQQEGKPECGLVFCLKAINLCVNRSVSQRDLETQRRALNVASNCCLQSGDYIDAIEFGLISAALARDLKREDAMIAALVNVTAALTHIGQTEEACQIAKNVAKAYERRNDCNEDIRLLLTNAAGAHLVDTDFNDASRCRRG